MLPGRLLRLTPRLKLRTALALVGGVALATGWYASMERLRSRDAWLRQQLFNARYEAQAAAWRAEARADELLYGAEQKSAPPRVRFEGAKLPGVVITAGDGAFQRAVFDNADLSNGSLTAGVSSFQLASFNNAVLTGARLIGGGASFQLASFENADLENAVLRGNLQSISLKNAKCIGATISGSFQGANIDGAQFQRADLSAVKTNDLASCYFDSPPAFDRATKFPDGFDPVDQGWELVGPFRARE